jgi:RF-1 domain
MLIAMNGPHPASLPVERLLAECDVCRTRRGGPGGQHRNKVETAVVLTHRPTGIRAEASERRSQAENQWQALRRLRVRLAIEIRRSTGASRAAEPSPLWQSRSAAGRLAINPAHADFPALLAEALDVVADADFDVSAAADWLGVSGSQLVRLLKHEPLAWVRVNDGRRDRGLRPLH